MSGDGYGEIPMIWTHDIQDQHGFPAERIQAAAEKARDAFWQSVSDSFPECLEIGLGGEMGPGDDTPLEWGSNASLLTWLMWNSPENNGEYMTGRAEVVQTMREQGMRPATYAEIRAMQDDQPVPGALWVAPYGYFMPETTASA